MLLIKKKKNSINNLSKKFYYLIYNYKIYMGGIKMTNKDKSIVEISIFTAIGNLKELEKSVNLGLDNELTVNEIKRLWFNFMLTVDFHLV